MKKLLLSLFLIISSCSTPSELLPYHPASADAAADAVTFKTALKIREETGLTLIGTGGGGSLEQLRKLNMCFQQKGELSVKQARKLIVYCVNEYLSAINSNEKLKPYLTHSPFTPADIEIKIFIFKKDQTDVDEGVLSVVSEMGGKIKYRPQLEGLGLGIYQEETFEEAVKILEAEKAASTLESRDH